MQKLQKMLFSSVDLLYNACRVTGYSAFLIKDIIYKNSVGLSSAPPRRLYEATNILTAPRTSYNFVH